MFKRKEVERPSLLASLLIFVFLIVTLVAQVVIQGSSDAHITLIVS